MTGIIIQARLDSTRLPAKVMLDLGGKTILQRVVEACLTAKKADMVLVTTPDELIADYVVEYTKAYPRLYKGIRDPLAEYYQAALGFGLDVIVRVTADCPFIRPDIIDYCITEHITGCYTYNHCDSLPNPVRDEPSLEVFTSKRGESLNGANGWPDGLDCEVFDRNCLKDAHEFSEQREHLTTYIREKFKNNAVKPFEIFDPERYFSINTIKDYKKALSLF